MSAYRQSFREGMSAFRQRPGYHAICQFTRCYFTRRAWDKAVKPFYENLIVRGLKGGILQQYDLIRKLLAKFDSITIAALQNDES